MVAYFHLVCTRELRAHVWDCDSAVPVLESPFRGESDTLAFSRAPVLPSGCFDTVGALIVAISELINFRDTQPALLRPIKGTVRCLFATLSSAPLPDALARVEVRMVRYSFPV
jgi:hypothetical protein